MAFGLTKTLLDGACRAVARERSTAYHENGDASKLFGIASTHLLSPPRSGSGEAEARRSLAQTLTGLSTGILWSWEFCKRRGFTPHGSRKPCPAMESVQALLAAEAADTIIGFLHRVDRQDRTRPPSPRALYDGNEAFNDSVDETHGPIRILEIEFRASEVLFQMEPESYRIYAAEFDEEAERTAASADAPPGAAS